MCEILCTIQHLYVYYIGCGNRKIRGLVKYYARRGRAVLLVQLFCRRPLFRTHLLNCLVHLLSFCAIFIGPRWCLWGPIYGSGFINTERRCADLTDVTLADEDTNSILTDNANREIQGNVAMQVIQPGDQCKLCYLVTQFATNASGASW